MSTVNLAPNLDAMSLGLIPFGPEWGLTQKHAVKCPAVVGWRVHPFDYGIGHEGVYALTSRPEQAEAWRRKGWKVEALGIVNEWSPS